jgi:hypothetical protein
LVELNKTCAYIFGRIGSLALVHVHEELRDSNYFAAYEKICKYFTNAATSNPGQFEAIARSVLIQPGQDFQSHWITLQISLKNWAMILGMEIETLDEPLIVPLDPLIPPPPPVAKAINVPEAIANAGDSSDAQLKALGHRVLIHETTRIQILSKSLNGLERFVVATDAFYGLKGTEKNLRKLIDLLETRDISIPGQRFRKEELENSGGNKLSKDESPTKKALTLGLIFLTFFFLFCFSSYFLPKVFHFLTFFFPFFRAIYFSHFILPIILPFKDYFTFMHKYFNSYILYATIYMYINNVVFIHSQLL